MQDILLIEDDQWIARLLLQVVASLWPQARLEHHEDLRRALNRIRRQPPDLLLADLQLPDGSGLEAIRALARLRPDSQRILLTGQSSRALVLEARAAGITGFIAKPFSLDELLQRLQKLAGSQPLDGPLASDGNLLDYLSQRSRYQLHLPLLPPLPSQPATSAAQLLTLCEQQPALSALLIGRANSEHSDSLTNPCLTPEAAIAQLGSANVSDWLQLQLQRLPQLQDEDLCQLASQWQQQQEEMRLRLQQHARQQRMDPAPLLCACNLSRLGELSVLCAVQNYRQLGQQDSAEQLQQALRDYSGEFGNQVKARLALPNALRQLIGALFVSPRGTPGKGQLLMRLAALESGLCNAGDEQQQLLRLLGSGQ